MSDEICISPQLFVCSVQVLILFSQLGRLSPLITALTDNHSIPSFIMNDGLNGRTVVSAVYHLFP